MYPIALGQTESAWNALTLHWPLGVRFSVSFIPHEQLLLVSYPPSTKTTIPTITTTEALLVLPCIAKLGAWAVGSQPSTICYCLCPRNIRQRSVVYVVVVMQFRHRQNGGPSLDGKLFRNKIRTQDESDFLQMETTAGILSLTLGMQSDGFAQYFSFSGCCCCGLAHDDHRTVTQ